MTNGIAPTARKRPSGFQEGLYQIVGHWNADLLEGKNGEQISAAAINFHDETFEGVRSYQFLQSVPGKCLLAVVPGDSPISDRDIERIGRNVTRKIGGSIEVEVKVASDVILTDQGKYKMVIRVPQPVSGVPV